MKWSLQDYDDAVKERCACLKLIEIQSKDRVRILNEAALDPFIYSTVTLVHSRRGMRETFRGYIALGKWETRIYNTDRKLVCSGAPTGDNAAGDLTCFGGKTRAVGALRMHEVNKLIPIRHRIYGVGAYSLSNGERMDMVVNLTDRELRDLLPDFPN